MSDDDSPETGRAGGSDSVGDGASGTDSGRTDAGEGREDCRVVGEHRVRGVEVDAATRCAHYDTDRDVVALRYACCDTFYPCHACHEARADHAPEQWPRERFDEPAVLCGACGVALSVRAYLDCDDACPACGHPFNPGCKTHADRYFEV